MSNLKPTNIPISTLYPSRFAYKIYDQARVKYFFKVFQIYIQILNNNGIFKIF